MTEIPIVVPKPPWEYSRFYFMFGRPISTDDVSIGDAEQCADVYRQSQDAVGECLTYLLENRGKDPYKDLGARLLYETTNGRTAPTFTPPKMPGSGND